METTANKYGNKDDWAALCPLIASTLSDAGVPRDCATDLCRELKPWVEACRGGFRTHARVPPEIRPQFERTAGALIRFLHETNLEIVSRLIDREIDYHSARHRPTCR